MTRKVAIVRATVLATVRHRNRSSRVMGSVMSAPTSSRRTSLIHPRASRIADQPQGASAIGWRMAAMEDSSVGW